MSAKEKQSPRIRILVHFLRSIQCGLLLGFLAAGMVLTEPKAVLAESPEGEEAARPGPLSPATAWAEVLGTEAAPAWVLTFDILQDGVAEGQWTATLWEHAVQVEESGQPQKRLIHYPSSRLFLIDRAQKRFFATSIHADLDFRLTEYSKRVAMIEKLKQASTEGTATPSSPFMTHFWASTLMRLTVPTVPAGFSLQRLEDGGLAASLPDGQRFEASPSTHRIPDRFKRGWRRVSHLLPLHPRLAKGLSGMGLLPERLLFPALHLSASAPAQDGTEGEAPPKPTVQERELRLVSAEERRLVPALDPAWEPDPGMAAGPMQGFARAILALLGQAVAGTYQDGRPNRDSYRARIAAANAQQDGLEASLALAAYGLRFGSMAARCETHKEDPPAICAVATEAMALTREDPEGVALHKALALDKQQRHLEAAKELGKLEPETRENGHMLSLFIANALTEALAKGSGSWRPEDRSRAIQAAQGHFLASLQGDPYIASKANDLARFFRGLFYHQFAWACIELGQAIPESEKDMLWPFEKAKAQMMRQFPEFY